jgi:uncharacterized protein (DUF2237 family)
MTEPKNVLGTKLEHCCTSPMTGFYRDGFCTTNLENQDLPKISPKPSFLCELCASVVRFVFP